MKRSLVLLGTLALLPAMMGPLEAEAHSLVAPLCNGGVTTIEQSLAHLAHVDGVMMGRAAYQSPWVLSDVDRAVFGVVAAIASRVEALEAFKPYVVRELAKGAPLNAMTKHVLGLFNGLPGARAFRRHLSENAVKAGAGIDVIDQALDFVRDSAARVAA